MKITIVGTGYVGLTSAACLAELGHEILCLDVDEKKIASLIQGNVPFFEPGLDQLLKRNSARKKLQFTTDKKQAIEFGEVIFNCVGTPSGPNGEADLSAVFSVAKDIAQTTEKIGTYKILVIKSTVPPGTSRKIQEIVDTSNSKIDVVSNPEFLREGEAIRAFQYPDKIVLGSHSDKALRIMRKVYAGRLRTYLPIVETDWETAELIKYASNAMLATRISTINEIANICDHVNADIKIVSTALGMDYRIGPRFLNAGVGWGGSCFPKDVKALIHTAKQHGYDAKLFEQTYAVNDRQRIRIIEKIKTVMNIENKTFCIWGLSFKPKTSDMREAPSITIINELLKHKATVQVYDPEAMNEAKKIFNTKVTYSKNPEEAAKDAHAIILVTEWDEFRGIDFAQLKKTMKDNKLFDGRNIYEPELIKEEGFEYYGMGRK